MNKTFAAITLFAVSLTGTGFAHAWDDRHEPHGHHDEIYYDKAKVLWVEPIYETVRISHPEQHCWNEPVRYSKRGHSSYTGTIAGGIIGGVVGNQFGQGSGKTAATVAGTLLGASVGHDLSHRPGKQRVHYERHCETRHTHEYREELVGYRVKYRYHGKTYWTRTHEHPGKFIRVRVDVEPAGY